MNDFVTVALRWTVRIFLLLAATVFFLSLLAAACLLALAWGVRALWAKLTGRPVMPWVMGVSPSTAWSSVYRSRTVWSAAAGPTEPRATDGGVDSLRRRVSLLHASDDVVDVQPREVREP